MEENGSEDDILHVLAVKLPFFLAGILVGMLVVWISLMWVPEQLAEGLLKVQSKLSG